MFGLGENGASVAVRSKRCRGAKARNFGRISAHGQALVLEKRTRGVGFAHAER